jgi:predicted nucleotidyltransferase
MVTHRGNPETTSPKEMPPMRSIVQRKSYGSVTVFWLDRKAAVEAVRSAARQFAQNDTRVRRVVLFGSLAAGTATAASDADILVVVSHTDLSILDRPVVFREHFSSIGLPAEVFVYTEAEIDSDPPPIAVHALQHGMSLFEATSQAITPDAKDDENYR